MADSFIKAVRIFLFILIIIGIGLLITRGVWVPKLVNRILSSEIGYTVPPVASSTEATSLLPTSLTPKPTTHVIIPTKTNSGIEGVATIGPTCPVVHYPIDPNCADKPYETTLVLASTIIGRNGGVLIHTDAKGYFSHDLAPGTYTIRAQSSAIMPRLTPIRFEVKANERLTLNLQFDSGIR